MATLRLEQRLSPEEIALQMHLPVKLVRDFLKRLEAELREDFS